MNQDLRNTNVVDEIKEYADDELDLFSEELEDRFNAKIGSTASTVACVVGCLSSASSACCLL